MCRCAARRPIAPALVLSLASLLSVALPHPALAFAPKAPASPLDDLVFVAPELRAAPLPSELGDGPGTPAAARSAWQAFRGRYGAWGAILDRRSGLVHAAAGPGIRWIPAQGPDPSLADMERIARAFIAANPSVFPLGQESLRLNMERSGHPAGYLWFVDFDRVVGGLAVDGARVVFHVNHGNLVQFGIEGPARPDVDVVPALAAAAAWDVVKHHVPDFDPARDRVTDPGTLRVVPALAQDGGYRTRLVWSLSFERPGATGTWSASVDAHDGTLLAFVDTNEYGAARGGVQPHSPLDPEVQRPLPFVDTGLAAPNDFANSAGLYTYTAGTAASALHGKYVSITDSCGAISVRSSAAPGNLDFGASGGNDCATPGFGGDGNTHSARSSYYVMNRVAERARFWLPANTWLQSRLVDNVNIEDTCNAYWNGTSVNFFRSGDGCGNTGELAAVMLHEWGHGLDANDGNGAADKGTGEAYGDTTALIDLHDSCMGPGFTATNCDGYGNTCLNCTGIRDVDYAKHANPVPATPQNIFGSVYSCPPSTTYAGPLGREGHCESLVASQAIWDLAARDLRATLDAATAWMVLDRLWYLSRATAAAAYTATGANTASGCGTGNWYRVFLVADDDDGNLANGTPHAAAIAATFNRHQIGGPCAGISETSSTSCPALATPSLTASPGNTSVVLNWGAVAGAARYAIYRNESGCDDSYARIANVAAPTTTYTDTQVGNGAPYFYRVLAEGTSSACHGAASACGSATPQPCTAPAAPGGVGTSAVGPNVIRVTWNAVGGATSYAVHRSNGACPGGTFARVGTVDAPATSFDDGTVSGGSTYSYKVTALVAGGCESAPSACSGTTATGSCSSVPTFAGLDSASSATTGECRVDLAWGPATPNCAGTQVRYNVYRSTTSGFDPSPANRVDGCLTPLGFADLTVAGGTTYHYVVRAEDSTSGHGGTCGGGNEDANRIQRSATARGLTFLEDAFEGGLDDHWTPSGAWNWSTADAHSATHAAHSGAANASCGSLTLKTALALPAGSLPGLSFWTRFDIESGFDAGVVEASDNGGTTWTKLTLSPPYPGTTNGTTSSCVGQNQASFTGTSAGWAAYTADLAAYASRNLLLRFRYGTDESQLGGGWYVDDVTVYDRHCTPPCAPPSPPSALVATPATNSVVLTWGASATAGVTYTVRRSDGACPGGTFATLATSVAGTSFTDNTAQGGHTYSYLVTAATGCESAPANCASATPDACTTPGAPSGLTATTPAQRTIRLTWSPGAPAGARYEVHRAGGACPGDVLVKIAETTATTYDDTTVSGGMTYSYRVRALSATGGCLSTFSACAQATATGTGGCLTPPTFDGLASATSTSGDGTCEITLSWNAARSNCGTKVAYNVYRSLTAGFTPGPSNALAKCLEGLAIADAAAAPGTTYYYVVRAEDDTSGHGGTCRGGNEDANRAERNASVAVSGNAFRDDMEAGAGSWTHSAGPGTDTWAIHVSSPNHAHSGTHDWFASGPAGTADQFLVTNAFAVPPGARLSFWHWFDLERGANRVALDAAVLEVSTDGGTTWADLGPRILAGGYNAEVAAGNPVAGRAAWSGKSERIYVPMSAVVVDLAPYAGLRVKLRFRLASNGSVASAGWHVDDVTVAAPLADEVEAISANWESQASGGSIANDYWMLVADPVNEANDVHSYYGPSVALGADNDDYLISAPVVIPSAAPELSFWHHYNLEGGYDGAQLYLSTDRGATWTDLGPFITSGNGYNGSMSGGPLSGGTAWTGNSGGWDRVTVDLSAFANTTAAFLFRNASDATAVVDGWYVDDVVVTDGAGSVVTFRDDLENLAPGWSTAAASGSVYDDWWAVATMAPTTSPTHAWFGADVAYVNDFSLRTAPFTVPAAATLSFQHYFDLEAGAGTTGYDGAVLEISADGGGTWADLGNQVTAGGYNRTISSGYGSPIAGRAAWSGVSDAGGVFRPVSVDLGSYAGRTVVVRFRLASDQSEARQGWFVDDVRVASSASCTPGTRPGEVSANASGRPLLIRRSATPGKYAFTWQSLGAVADGYDIYEGTLGSWYSHANLACHVPLSRTDPCPQGAACTDEAGNVQMDGVALGAGNRYYLVSSSNEAGEGPYGTSSSGNPRTPAGTACGAQ